MLITTTYIWVLLAAFVLMGLLAFVDSDFFAKKYSEKMQAPARNAFIWLLVFAIIYLCYQNFPVTLTLIVLITGFIFLIDLLFFARKRKANNKKPGTLVKNAREFFPILALVWGIRSFVIQPYHVPSGSLEPTIMTGDFIAVKQYAYGFRFPIGNFTLIKTGKPKTGDIALFYNPTDLSKVFIKRVIGVPGDRIQYKNKVLYVNGIEAKQQLVTVTQDNEPGFNEPITVEKFSEDLSGIKHDIYVWPVGGETQDFDIVVPAGNYFMMGDNRDDSDDSRTGLGSGSGQITYVPEENFIGRGFVVWMNWDPITHSIHWNRIGKKL